MAERKEAGKEKGNQGGLNKRKEENTTIKNIEDKTKKKVTKE
jgi:hypothetical protein